MKTKTNFITLTLCILATLSSMAQKKLDSLTYEQTQDIAFFKSVKSRTLVTKYITANKNTIQVGDTLILGNTTSQEMSTRTYGGSYGSRGRVGASKSRSTSKKTYEFIKLGRPAGFGSLMSAMNGSAPSMASNSLKNTKTIVKEIKAYHKGSKKKPLYVVMVLGEINGRAFDINKYLSVMNAELAIESGEILLKNRKMTREEAIAKLREAKELFEIDMLSKEEFDSLKAELAPIIRAKK